jgi:pimeloyl-ACP methyl ester carboxylesterase
MHPRFLCRFAILSVLIGTSSSLADDAKPAPIVLGRCLILAPPGRGGRSPIHQDAVEAEIVHGRWKTPKAGDAVPVPDGPAPAWQEGQADDKGAISDRALLGGYVFWPVNAPKAGVHLLEASGHVCVYVNGQLRTGDVYSHGIVRLPVALKEGSNELLFLVGRGQLSARLVPAPSPALLDTRDTTLPDLLTEEKTPVWASIVVLNASTEPLAGLSLAAEWPGAEPLRTSAPTLPPLSQRKVGFRIPAGTLPMADKATVKLRLESGDKLRDEATATVRIRKPNQSQRRTFLSEIDGSVQYFALQPAQPNAENKDRAPGLVLSLHGAGVEAVGQVECYGSKPWCHIVAPTNRRSYGFDWEDWGRLDALEVLELAKKQLKTDPQRTYLTGHSMGGHGAWQLGVHYPDHFAAIGPSAGWVSMRSYAGAPRAAPVNTIDAMLQRGAAGSDTLSLVRNYTTQGVFILHGDKDDNVPVQQAHVMRQELGAFHPDFVYHEQPGAGHWWGNACMDWPPLFEFLSQHTLPRTEDVRRVEFQTVSPAVSAWSHWAGIEAQVRPLQVSTVKLQLNPAQRQFSGTTENVARLAIDLSGLKPGEPVQVELDGRKIDEIAWPKDRSRIWLQREGKDWIKAKEPAPGLKGPLRYGPFKEAFRNRVVFVYGTRGNDEENAWAYTKARYDAETFWYRGNASVDLVADKDFDPAKEQDRNVIVYGNAQGHGCWAALLGDSPVQVKRGEVVIGDRKEKGDDLGCLFVRPRPGSHRALVGVVAGTGLPGMRVTDRMPIFASGVGYPDLLLLDAKVLTRGSASVHAAGFFGIDWGVASGEIIWRKEP